MKLINLKDLPNNILNIYFKSLKQECPIVTDFSDVKIHTFVEGKKACYMRLLYKDDKYFYKIFNYYDSCLPNFMQLTKYDKVLPIAIKKNFYNNITLVDSFIYDNINDRIIGYKYPILNPISNIDKYKYQDLIIRITEQTKKTNIVYTDLVPQNIMEYNDKYYIIDLECVTTLDVYRQKNVRLKHFITNNKVYERNIHLITCLQSVSWTPPIGAEVGIKKLS